MDLDFYPLVTMDITRKQLTNVEQAQENSAPMNTFANIPAYPTRHESSCPAKFRHAVFQWLAISRKNPWSLSPDTACRYYLFPMLDMWTDVFASPGWRTTGTQAANFP